MTKWQDMQDRLFAWVATHRELAYGAAGLAVGLVIGWVLG